MTHHVEMDYKKSTHLLVMARIGVDSAGAAVVIVKMAFFEAKGSRSLPTSSSKGEGSVRL